MNYRNSTARSKVEAGSPAWRAESIKGIGIEKTALMVEYRIVMKLPGKLTGRLQPRRLTRVRIALALIAAVTADGLQLFLNFFGWVGADQLIDVVAMVLTSWLIGFHWLLLPTFVLEFVPLVGELPTWTACVIAVVALRQREQAASPPESV